MNPELLRNLWLELSPHRLLLWTAVVLLGALLAGQLGVLQQTALLALGATWVLWGTRRSLDAIADEINDRTWDVQCMAALDPWSMTWGKLAGAASPAWYCGSGCAAAYLAAGGTTATVLLVAGMALAAHGLALMLALQDALRQRRTRTRFGTPLLLLMLIALPQWLMALLDDLGTLRWYGFAFAGLDFALVSAWLAAGWSVLGAWRAMATALRAPTLPLAWPTFALFWSAWLGGFVAVPSADALPVLARCASIAVLLCCVQAYLAAFLSDVDAVTFRRLGTAWQRRQWRRFAEEMPLALVSLLLALPLALVASAVPAGNASGFLAVGGLGAGALGLVGLALRDIALLHALGFGRTPERAVATTLVYLLLLYVLLPALADAAGLALVAGLLRPSPFAAPGASALVYAVQGALACALAAALWWRTTARLTRAGDRRS